jgi:hypothetical protein
MPRQGARAIENFFASFAFFTSKWSYRRVTGPQNKIFIKNQLLYIRQKSTVVYSSKIKLLIYGIVLTYAVRYNQESSNMQDQFLPELAEDKTAWEDF